MQLMRFLTRLADIEHGMRAIVVTQPLIVEPFFFLSHYTAEDIDVPRPRQEVVSIHYRLIRRDWETNSSRKWRLMWFLKEAKRTAGASTDFFPPHDTLKKKKT